MKKVFISYRRDDSAAMAGRLYDSLSARFGPDRVFFDIDTLRGGREFRKEIADCLAETGVLLAVIGPQWRSILLERAANPDADDYVAIELQTASALAVPIVPVLAGKRAKADFESFGSSENELARLLGSLQASEIDEGKDYRNHVVRLIRDIEEPLGISGTRRLRVLRRAAIVVVALLTGYGLAHWGFRAKYRRLPQNALAVGLRSIESRSDLGQAFPPEVVLRRAQNELFLSGVSCYRTFDQYKSVIDELAAGNRRLYVLIMDPDSPDVAELSQRLNKPVDSEIRQVITIIKNSSNLRTGNLHLRLMLRMPPFTAVMIDGNVARRYSLPDLPGAVRIQPLIANNTQNRGVILEFEKGTAGEIDGFGFYSEDLQRQWEAAAESDEKVAEMLRADNPAMKENTASQ